MLTKYTIKSMVNGRYIGSLFSDTHEDTFNTHNIDDAYVWASLENAHKVKDEIGLCSVVALPNKEK